MSSCIFCEIAAEDAPARIVGLNDGAIAVLDINPASDGHTLVLPRAHADDIWTIEEQDAVAVWSLVREVAGRLREVLRPDGLTLFQANGRAGWQDVFHFHLHVVPRWSGDALVKPWDLALADPANLDEIAARLSPG